MNTARALGPMVVAGFKSNDFVWFVGPYLGALIATVVYKVFVIARFPLIASDPGQPLISGEVLRKEDRETSDPALNEKTTEAAGHESLV